MDEMTRVTGNIESGEMQGNPSMPLLLPHSRRMVCGYCLTLTIFWQGCGGICVLVYARCQTCALLASAPPVTAARARARVCVCVCVVCVCVCPSVGGHNNLCM
jgi:hypothetical protein